MPTKFKYANESRQTTSFKKSYCLTLEVAVDSCGKIIKHNFADTRQLPTMKIQLIEKFGNRVHRRRYRLELNLEMKRI